MFKKLLEAKGIETNDTELNTVMCMTTDDIKFNRVSFKMRTSIEDVVSIMEKSILALRRCS